MFWGTSVNNYPITAKTAELQRIKRLRLFEARSRKLSRSRFATLRSIRRWCYRRWPGVTDVSFRRLLKRRGGIGLTVSEFISVEGLTRNNPKSKRQMRFYEDERPFAVQIFGGQVNGCVWRLRWRKKLGLTFSTLTAVPGAEGCKHGGGSGC